MRDGLVLGLMLVLGAQAGCGSSSPGGGGGGSVTSITSSKPLNTLTTGEMTQLCSDTEAYLNAHLSIPEQCKLLSVALAGLSGGSTDADVQSTCNTFYSACTTAGPTQTCDLGQLSTCAPSATVAEFSTCFADNTAATKLVVDGLPACSGLTAAYVSTLDVTIPTPASCTHLLSECPDINTGG